MSGGWDDTSLIVTVEGPGLLDVTVWQQHGSLAVHLVNLSNPNLYGANVVELLPVGEQMVRLRLPAGVHPAKVQLLRAGVTVDGVSSGKGRLEVRVLRVLDHEVVAVDLA